MHEVLVIGGGPAGAAFAIKAAEAGRDVVLLEQTSGPTDKVCGEFLSGEALAYLQALGVSPRNFGAVPITHVRLAARDAGTRARLPFPALSLTRRRMDELLLERAAQAGADVRRGAQVEKLTREPGDWVANLAGGEAVLGAEAVLATGKHDLRGHPRPPGRQNGLVGLKTYWRLTSPQREELSGSVELLLFCDGYAGLQLVEDGVANLTCLVRKERLRGLGGHAGLLSAMQQECPLLKRRLQDAQPMLEKTLAITSLPYGLVRRSPPEAGLWALGDQAAVIPSFTGDGMSIALHSGLLAARMFLDGASAEEFQGAMARRASRPVWLATALSRGLLRTSVRSGFVAAARVFPPVMRWAATATRVE